LVGWAHRQKMTIGGGSSFLWRPLPYSRLGKITAVPRTRGGSPYSSLRLHTHVTRATQGGNTLLPHSCTTSLAGAPHNTSGGHSQTPDAGAELASYCHECSPAPFDPSLAPTMQLPALHTHTQHSSTFLQTHSSQCSLRLHPRHLRHLLRTTTDLSQRQDTSFHNLTESETAARHLPHTTKTQSPPHTTAPPPTLHSYSHTHL